MNEMMRDIYEDFYTAEILYEFIRDKKAGIAYKHWSLIPAEQYKNLLSRYMEMGDAARIPESTVRAWMKIIAKNAVELEACTEFAGHSQYFPYDDFYEVFDEDEVLETVKDSILTKNPDPNSYEVCSEYLEKIGFYDWLKLPDGSDAWSDYGLKPLFEILYQYDDYKTSAEDTLILINRCLDVAHCRGDLASCFIEGGSATCSSISSS